MNRIKLSETSFTELPATRTVHCSSIMPTVDGNHKIVLVIYKANIFTVTSEHWNGDIDTTIEKLNFSDIPSNADIIAIQCINRSSEFDDFVMGLTYVTTENENPETYFNIYSGSPGSTFEDITENCEKYQLNFDPFHLNYAVYVHETLKKGMWLISGSDKKIHAYKIDKKIYEQNIEEYFVEFEGTKDSIIARFGTKAFSDFTRRVSFYGCGSGYAVLKIVDSKKNEILHSYEEYFQSPITVMQLFNLHNRTIKTKNILSDNFQMDYNIVNEKDQVCLLVAGASEFSVVYMDVLEKFLSKGKMLKRFSRRLGEVNMTSVVADVNFDSKNEILIGTSGNNIFSYVFRNDKWVEQYPIYLRSPVYAMCYADITNEGIKNMVVLTKKGLHLLKHSHSDIIKLLKKRLKPKEVKVN